jgi:hypothetical protein
LILAGSQHLLMCFESEETETRKRSFNKLHILMEFSLERHAIGIMNPEMDNYILH